ncbi:hypothetical protein [Brevibacillus brevis]|uniref:Amidohydrolase-related domain-containing protein n=1 Tax=Brevibacillus brevis TaxID=1393 RepID=A0ABY9T7K3_BREBE|nr:hypothetical protein [Brevibacillus brevis]WNC16080.1 hypothetical protein RGB73_07115 [Brevibacillus brevis]
MPNLVYSARGSEVETVIIDGQIIMEDRKLLTVDEKQPFEQCRRQQRASALALVTILRQPAVTSTK